MLAWEDNFEFNVCGILDYKRFRVDSFFLSIQENIRVSLAEFRPA